MAPTKLYKPTEAALLLSLTVGTIHKRILAGSIQAVRLSSRAIRIPEAELLRIQRDGFGPRRPARPRRPNCQRAGAAR